MPLWSSPSRTGSASTPPTATHTRCGARRRGSPSTTTSSTAVAAARMASVRRRASSDSRAMPAGLRSAPRRRRRTRRCPRRSRGRRAAPAPARLRRPGAPPAGRAAPPARPSPAVPPACARSPTRGRRRARRDRSRCARRCCTRRRAPARRGGDTPRRPRARAGWCPPRGWPPGSARALRAIRPGPPPRARLPPRPGRCARDGRRRGARPHPHAPRPPGPRSARPPRARRDGPGRARVAPHVAALTASVPPDVKTTWRGRVPSSAATCSRAASTVARTMRPSVWTRPGSPTSRREDSNQPIMAATTSGRGGEVEAWSR